MEALPHMIVFLIYIIYLFIFDCAGSSLLCGLFSSCGERVRRGDSSLVAVRGLLIEVASLIAEHEFLGQAGFSDCGTWAR